MEQPPGRHREARRVADRPRPDARLPLRPCSGSPTSPTRCSTSSAPSAGRRPAAARACTSTCGSRPTTASQDVRRAALAFAREVERRAPDDVTTDLVAQGPRPGAPVRRLQPERPRPHHRRGVLGARQPRRHGLRADPLGRGRRRATPTTSRSPPCRPASPSSATCTPASTTQCSTSRRCWSGPSATRPRAPSLPSTPERRSCGYGWRSPSVCQIRVHDPSVR